LFLAIITGIVFLVYKSVFACYGAIEIIIIIINVCCMLLLFVRMDITAVNMTLSEYEKKLSDPLCCLMLKTVQRHLTLPPKYLGKMADGIREQLDSKLKLYCEEYVVLFIDVLFSSA